MVSFFSGRRVPNSEQTVHLFALDLLSQPLCAADQDPEPLVLPWPAWGLRQRQQSVSILASQTS